MSNQRALRMNRGRERGVPRVNILLYIFFLGGSISRSWPWLKFLGRDGGGCGLRWGRAGLDWGGWVGGGRGINIW